MGNWCMGVGYRYIFVDVENCVYGLHTPNTLLTYRVYRWIKTRVGSVCRVTTMLLPRVRYVRTPNFLHRGEGPRTGGPFLF